MKGFAIYTDLSGVALVEDGGFPTRRAALESLIQRLEAQRADATRKLAVARRSLRRELTQAGRDLLTGKEPTP